MLRFGKCGLSGAALRCDMGVCVFSKVCKVGFLALVLAAVCASPVWACSKQAKSDLEAAFCKIKARKPGSVPYSLQDFRKNPATTQYLLLKRHAERLGITLVRPKPVNVKPKLKPRKNLREPPSSEPSVVPKQATSELSCVLTPDAIKCPGGTFVLLGNLKNAQLPSQAFNTGLKLAPPPDKSQAPGVHNRYLLGSYRKYIEAMVAIGLGGATMSFTKFFHTFQEVQQKGAKFHARMHTMFEYLKKDKLSMGVKRHFTKARPKSMGQCEQISPSLWVCDDVKNNWVYRLQ